MSVRHPLALVGMIGLLYAATTSVGYPQQSVEAPRIAMVLQGAPEDTAPGVEAFRQGLRDLGYVEGQNLTIEYRYFPPDRHDLLPGIATSLVQSKVDVLIAMSTPEIRALMQATDTIPILMVVPGDPVGAGLIKSLARPGGNVTGLTIQSIDLDGKRVELLEETVPRLSRIGVLFNPGNSVVRQDVAHLQAAGKTLGVTIHPVEARNQNEIVSAFSTVAEARDQAVVVVVDALTFINRKMIVDLCTRGRLPAMFYARPFVELGGLMSYGPRSTDLFRRAASYADKLLKGAKPADLPVEQPAKFEFVINLKTAKALGLTIPQSILLRADEVIR